MGPQRRSGSAPRQQSFARHPDARSKPDQRPAWNVSAQVHGDNSCCQAHTRRAPHQHCACSTQDTNGNVDKWKLTPDELVRAMHGRDEAEHACQTAHQLLWALCTTEQAAAAAHLQEPHHSRCCQAWLSRPCRCACMHASAQLDKCHLTGNPMQHKPAGQVSNLRTRRMPASRGVLRVLVCMQTGLGTRAQAVSTQVKEAAAVPLLASTMVPCCRCCSSQRGGAVQGPAPRQVQTRCSSPPQWPPHPGPLRRKQRRRRRPWQKLPVGYRWT